jgi:hypothetical protein
MAYLTRADFGSQQSTNQKVTLRCKDGDKLIFLAVNIGGEKLIKHEGGATTNSSQGNSYIGKDWNTANNYGPKFSVAYQDNDNVQHEALNSPIWSGATSIVFETASGFTIPNNLNANNLIQALTGDGDPANGVLFGNGSINSYYLMSNWDGPDDKTNATPGTDYSSTCRFNLKPGITAEASRDAAATIAQNAIKINIQRAIAKVSVLAITSSVQSSAGTGTSRGSFTPDARWALGNINTSTYPFQVWEGSGSSAVLKSTRFNDSLAILPITNNPNFQFKMDNSRWAGSNTAYVSQTLTAANVRTAINSSSNGNQEFTTSSDNFALITENNNENTFTHYSSFVTFAGVYTPSSYIKTVSNLGTYTAETATPTYSNGPLDTMYFVSTFANNGLFFHGLQALAEYVKYNLKINDGGNTPPLSDQTTIAYINNLKNHVQGGQAPLQAYHKGVCFYRVWISDNKATSAANIMSVRRNHAYRISIKKINGPGIGDPNDVIPDPYSPIPIEEADTYVTASVQIMNWHLINQNEEIGLK